MLATNTLATVHQRLRDEHDVRVSVTSLRRYVWRAFPDRHGGPEPTVLRPPEQVPPGQEIQIDYGYLGRWCDPLGGRIRRVWAIVMVLACSRHMFVRPVLSMDKTSWVAAHTAAWEFFGGVPARLVIDYVARHIIRDHHLEHPAEELPRRLAPGDHCPQRLRIGQPHEHVTWHHRSGYVRPLSERPGAGRGCCGPWLRDGWTPIIEASS